MPWINQLEPVVQGIVTAMSSAQQSEVKAWEEEITACEHTLCLEQQSLIEAGKSMYSFIPTKKHLELTRPPCSLADLLRMRSFLQSMALHDLWAGQLR
jgi:hypothetical protein